MSPRRTETEMSDVRYGLTLLSSSLLSGFPSFLHSLPFFSLHLFPFHPSLHWHSHPTSFPLSSKIGCLPGMRSSQSFADDLSHPHHHKDFWECMHFPSF